MSRKGDCWDNAVVESFFHSLKVEALNGVHFRTRREAEKEVFDYIERFYNKVRRHSTLGYLSPENYEREMLTGTQRA
jgi:transposase InsO family protein